MKIVDIKVLKGPNYWSINRGKLIQMRLDLEEMEQRPTNTISGFSERIEKLLPTMYEHRCSEGVEGGFFLRVREGTWMGHVIEHIALELQTLAGMPCGFGRTRSTNTRGVYHVVFYYQIENAEIYAANAAVRIASVLASDEPYDIAHDIKELTRINKNEGLGPSTQAIVNEAAKRNIPYKRLDNDSLVMLGQGVHQKLIRASMACTTSSIGVEVASNKEETKQLLANSFVPVPLGKQIKKGTELEQVIEEIGFPLVIKPLNGNQGKGITA